MANNCPSCGSAKKDEAALCPACGWDSAAQRFAANPAGVDLLFAPSASAPPPPPAEPPPSSSPVDLAPEKSAAELLPPPPPPAPKGYPNQHVNALLKYVERSQAGREALENEHVQAVVDLLRNPKVFNAVVGVLGVWFLLTVYMFWPERSRVAATVAAEPAYQGYVRRSATFSATPRVVVAGPDAAAVSSATAVAAAALAPAPPPAPVPAPAPAPVEAPAPAAQPAAAALAGPTWIFQGQVFDLVTAKPVFAAKLTFVNRGGQAVASAETDTRGRYKIAVPSGMGYALRITHADYDGRYIDDSDPSKSLRAASAQEKQILLKAGTHNLSWIGNSESAVTRDLALVPLASQ